MSIDNQEQLRLTSLQNLIAQTVEESNASAGTIVTTTTGAVPQNSLKNNGKKRKLDVDIGMILSGDKPMRQRKALVILDPSQSASKTPPKMHRGRGPVERKRLTQNIMS